MDLVRDAGSKQAEFRQALLVRNAHGFAEIPYGFDDIAATLIAAAELHQRSMNFRRKNRTIGPHMAVRRLQSVANLVQFRERADDERGSTRRRYRMRSGIAGLANH